MKTVKEFFEYLYYDCKRGSYNDLEPDELATLTGLIMLESRSCAEERIIEGPQWKRCIDDFISFLISEYLNSEDTNQVHDFIEARNEFLERFIGNACLAYKDYIESMFIHREESDWALSKDKYDPDTAYDEWRDSDLRTRIAS